MTQDERHVVASSVVQCKSPKRERLHVVAEHNAKASRHLEATRKPSTAAEQFRDSELGTVTGGCLLGATHPGPNRLLALDSALAGIPHTWDRLNGALEALTDARLQEYHDAVPNEWLSNNDAAEQVADYLGQARQNRQALFAVINRLLK